MMVLAREAALLVWLVCLVSLYCDVSGIANNVPTSPSFGLDDQKNWNLLSNYYSRNSTQRTSNAKLNVFSKILLANIKARTKVGRTGDGVFLFQGDIRIDKNQLSKLIRNKGKGKKGRRKRALLSDKARLWQSPIYYDFSPGLSKNAKKAIVSAIAEWRSMLPCIKWVKGKVAVKQQGYLYFIKGDGCYSIVGRSGNKRQEISIGDGCEDHGTVVHEIAHALGFGHEQSRSDRDKYVTIHWNNIIPNMKFNFEMYSNSEVDSLGKTYDYESVMHYGPYDFAKRDGLKTISSRQSGKNFGDKPKLSKLDIEQAQLLYKCSKGTTNPQPPTKAPMPSPSSKIIPPVGSGSGSGSSSIFAN